MADMKYLPVEFLLSSGLLFEINRQVLHPLGLAIEVQLDPEKGATIERIWDGREDGGWTYDKDTFVEGFVKLSTYLANRGMADQAKRHADLGYVVQELRSALVQKEEA